MRLRQATPADDEFCFRLNGASLREYIEPIYGWDLDVQRSHHAEWFDADRLSVIENDDGKAVGVVDVVDQGDHLYLSRIELLPEAQGRGLGTSVVRDLLRQGRVARARLREQCSRSPLLRKAWLHRRQRCPDEHHVSMHHPGATVEDV